MKQHLEFLQLRLDAIKKRIARTDDYKEMRVLEKMIAEITAESEEETVLPETTIVEEENKLRFSDPTPEPTLHQVIVNNGRKTYKKDMENSPVAQLKHGERIPFVYDLVEEIAKSNGGEISIPKLMEILKQDYGMIWEDLDKDGKAKNGRISSYINLYNEDHIDDQRLELFPKKEPGKTRVRRYEKVIYVGKERLSIVNG